MNQPSMAPSMIDIGPPENVRQINNITQPTRTNVQTYLPLSSIPSVQNEMQSEFNSFALLFIVSDDSGSLKTNEITEKPLTRAHLNTNLAYVLELE